MAQQINFGFLVLFSHVYLGVLTRGVSSGCRAEIRDRFVHNAFYLLWCIAMRCLNRECLHYEWNSFEIK